MPEKVISKRDVFIVCTILLVVHAYIYYRFYPNRFHLMGHDFSYSFPDIFDGYYWHRVNGFFSIPWFTPSFCGGLPKFFTPQTEHFSLAQFLLFFFGPIASTKITLTLFAGLGFSGFYLLLRKVFYVSRGTAVLGGTLFLFNTFYSHAFIVGHINYHGFMLLPFIALLILGSDKTGWGILKDSALAGFIIAYIYYSGMSQFLPPIMLSVFGIGLIYILVFWGKASFNTFAVKFFLASFFSIILASPSIIGALSFLKNFPREFYHLPGIPNMVDLLGLLIRTVFWIPDEISANAIIANSNFLVGRHEFEFGVTFIPLLIILLGCFWFLRFNSIRSGLGQFNLNKSLTVLSLLSLLSLPIILNFYSPSWNSFLKTIPIIKTSSTLIRWFSLYIPIVILLSALMLEKIPFLKRHNMTIISLGIIIIVVFNISLERKFYYKQYYDPNPIIKGYQESKKARFKPRVKEIYQVFNAQGKPAGVLGRNNFLASGYSYLLCYEPIFGYSLEDFRPKSLKPGPVLAEADGLLNIKNPACYVYPKENSCSPGDHFRADQMEEARAFVSYKNFPFKIPVRQKVANVLASMMLAAYLALFGYLFAGFILKYVRKKQNSSSR